ncbi:hypothetical protein Ciccas_000070 [Cichlidogyrus casuarinus]|uniref:Uncharacterized protein n=1 Tax=Cichlidogyrus casuarinus TaxID=1844966 RepID=A0ABD2QRE1_9PLAT
MGYGTETPDNVRLVASTLLNAGRLEVKHPQNHTWGTVCADGFGINEARAFCRMLFLYAFNREPANESQPIYLNGLICPPDADSLNDCDFGFGWDYSGSCTHGMDVGIQCGLQLPILTETPISPKLNCTKDAAVLSFNKNEHLDLVPSMLTLNNKPANCNFTSYDQESSIIVMIPYKGCGGLIIKDNPQFLSIRFNLTRQVIASETGIITALPRTFTATCVVPRDGAAKTDALASQVQAVTLAPVSDQRIVPTQIVIFSDIFFQHELRQPVDVPPNTIIYVKVKLVDPLPENKLILKSCWVTASEDPLSLPRQDLIVNKCPLLQGLNLIPISRTEIGFSMPMFYMTSQASSIVDTSSASFNNRLRIFFHCTTGLCHRSETSSACSQFCPNPSSIAATNLRSLRRVKRSLETDVYTRTPISYLLH